MSPTYPHGLPPAECLICRTLGMQPATDVKPGRSTTAGSVGSPAGRAGVEPLRSGPPERPGGRHRLVTELAAVAVAVVVIALVAWLLVGAVFSILHVLELILVAAAAGWVGYRIGRYRGRRER